MKFDFHFDLIFEIEDAGIGMKSHFLASKNDAKWGWKMDQKWSILGHILGSKMDQNMHQNGANYGPN